MQTPEKLSLIGGSILLASTLVFTMKSQASNILPKVDNGMTNMFKSDKDHQADQQKQQGTQEKQTFDKNYHQAQQKHWQTGTWGTTQFYVDDQGNMHVGGGQLQGSFSDVVNDGKIHSISLDENVQAPQDSSHLFADNNYNSIPLTQINGLAHLDTSRTTSMYGMFEEDTSLNNLDVSHFDTHNVTNMERMFKEDNLSSLDLSHFDTHNVTDMERMFEEDTFLNNLDISNFNTSHVTNMHDMFIGEDSLSNLDLSHFDTRNVNNMEDMFYDDSSLSHLDLSHFDTRNVTNVDEMLDEDNISRLTLGQNTRLQNNSNDDNYDTFLNGTYQSNGQALSLDGNAHPGTWVKQ